MIDNDIIKANHLCSKLPQQCKDCPFCKFDDCVSELAEKTIDLINRQKAEIERLEETKNRLSYNLQAVLDERADHSEAVKEVAEKVKQIICDHCYPNFNKDGKPINVWNATNGYKAIDNLVKEMVGEQNV